MYAGGKGVAEDYVEAYKWVILAAAQGNQHVVKFRDVLNRKMSSQQIAEAQRLAKEFKPKSESNNSAVEDTNKPKHK